MATIRIKHSVDVTETVDTKRKSVGNDRMKRVLVLKGGGLRGLIQLDALRTIERHFHKPIHQIFDLIVGTSVGSVTGGIMAKGDHTVEQYIEIFLTYFPLIFKSKWWRVLFGALYSRKNFYLMWKHLFYQKTILMKDCRTMFMATAVNVCDNRTHYFKSWEQKDGNEELRLQIAKSFAAPFYFGHLVDYKEKAVWIDGGAGTSNTPLDIALTETINLGWNNELTQFILLGTGTSDLSIPFDIARKQGEIRQMYSYIRPREGGLARIQSTLNKVQRMQIMAKANPLLDFRYYDVEIGQKMDALARVKYLPEYLAFGRIVADQVAEDLMSWPKK